MCAKEKYQFKKKTQKNNCTDPTTFTLNVSVYVYIMLISSTLLLMHKAKWPKKKREI